VYFLFCEDNRYVFSLLCSECLNIPPAHIDSKHLFVEKKYGIKCLILRRWTYFLLCSQIRQKSLYFIFTHFHRMFFIVKKNIVFYPESISFFCRHTVVFETNLIAYDIQQFLLATHNQLLYA